MAAKGDILDCRVPGADGDDQLEDVSVFLDVNRPSGRRAVGFNSSSPRRNSNKNGTVPGRCLCSKCLATVTTTLDGTVLGRGKDHIHSSSMVPGMPDS